jgi:UDP:flavonoid glycosyltransferase YjiC (YdhE family)
VAFLDGGAPPVYIGFGSMGNRNPGEAAELALRALEMSGQRGVIASGWGGLHKEDLPSSVYMLSSIPHSWLFPRMAAVVHHGGAGTTGAGLRASVPSIIVPFMGDQPFWGQQVSRLGVGTAPLPRKRLTADALARAITQVVTDATMRGRAADLGEQIRAEDGVGNAVEIIGRYVGRS